MNAIADKYASSNIGSIFLYTHEAHPGENYPHHTSFVQKLEHANALRDILGVTRQIVVDSLAGDCHRAYGTMPNMTWIINKAGTAVYKSDWSDSNSVENAIIYYLDVQKRRRDGERMAPFNVQRLDYRVQDKEKFEEGLKRSGPKAYREFIETGL